MPAKTHPSYHSVVLLPLSTFWVESSKTPPTHQSYPELFGILLPHASPSVHWSIRRRSSSVNTLAGTALHSLAASRKVFFFSSATISKGKVLMHSRPCLLLWLLTSIILVAILLIPLHSAERRRFELLVPCGTHAFQACTIGHSVTSPLVLQCKEKNFFEIIKIWFQSPTIKIVGINDQQLNPTIKSHD